MRYRRQEIIVKTINRLLRIQLRHASREAKQDLLKVGAEAVVTETLLPTLEDGDAGTEVLYVGEESVELLRSTRERNVSELE